MKNVHLQEKGKSVGNNGHATILAGHNGQPLSQQLTVLQDGTVGGSLVLIPRGKIIGRTKSNVPTQAQDSIFSLVLRRNGEIGTCKVTEYDSVTLQVKEAEIGFLIAPNGAISFCSDSTMLDRNEAIGLLSGKLNDAFAAAIERSFDCNPQSLYHGKIAQDCAIMRKEAYVNKP